MLFLIVFSGKIEISSSNTKDTLFFPQQTIVKDSNIVVTPSTIKTDKYTQSPVTFPSEQFVPSSSGVQTYQPGSSGVNVLPPAALQSTQQVKQNIVTQPESNVQQQTSASQQNVYVSSSEPTVSFSSSDSSPTSGERQNS